MLLLLKKARKENKEMFKNINNEIINLGFSNNMSIAVKKEIETITMYDYLKALKNVDFNRDLDKSYAGGLLDLSFEIVGNVFDLYNKSFDFNNLVFAVYELLWNKAENGLLF